MKIKDYKCKECDCTDFFFVDKGNQIGIYCSYCGKWLKWADKDEQNLRMKQEQESCEMTAEEYRQRMIQAFLNTGTDHFIALCVLPKEEEFVHLEWLLKNHYE